MLHEPAVSNSKGSSAREYGTHYLAVGTLPGSNSSSITAPINLVASLQADRPLLHLYGWGKETPRLRFGLPEAMSSIALSPARVGTGLCVGGSSSGKLYIWEIPSGELLRVIDGHYRAIRSLVFTDDGQTLISASDDATIHVWRLGEIFHPKTPPAPKPLHVWSDHTLPITNVVVGRGSGTLRAFSVSLDATCKVWDLASGKLLATFLLPSAAITLAVDAKETTLVVGCTNGLIYQLPLYKGIKNIPDQPLRSNIGDGKVLSVDAPASNTEDPSHACFKGHESSITSVLFDFTGTKLISGDKSGQVIVWDVASRQPIRHLSSGSAVTASGIGAVTSLHIFPTPQFLLRPGQDSEELTFPSIAPFSRIMEQKSNLSWLPPAQPWFTDNSGVSLFDTVPSPGLLPHSILDGENISYKTFGYKGPGANGLIGNSHSNFDTQATTYSEPQLDFDAIHKENNQLREINEQLYKRLLSLSDESSLSK
ncbi:Pre-rRNA-processing protein ipi3 [Entomophthora muscae]|uniref:Pre-rRNA-processing protein ipi3 n=1 Tax=Entomophthora muscae TaxID=34485 RepID=A0ACC2SZM0_9FUNG|nr:Pre-rRNA-processing protein ipi3 [Entomophthora muscae]